MGYYTSYKLEIHEDGKQYLDINDAENEIKEVADYSSLFTESCKWYTHEDDMRTFSQQHLDTVFKLQGEGEDAGDLWVKYFKNGKMQGGKATITYPEYDANNFK